MAQVIKEIQVEVSKPNFFQAIVAKQFDSKSRWLRATLVDNGEKITVPDGAAVTINARRSDGGESRFGGSVDKGKGTVLVPLSAWMLQLEGTVKSDITVSSSGKILTTTSFVIEVERASCQDSGVSEDDANVDILTQLILDVQAIKPDITYDPTSTNAQSGIAVEDAVGGAKTEIQAYVDNALSNIDLDIAETGKNLYNENSLIKGYALDNMSKAGEVSGEVDNDAYAISDWICVKENTQYAISSKGKNTSFRVHCVNADGKIVSNGNFTTNRNSTFTTPVGTVKLRLSNQYSTSTSDNTMINCNTQLEKGSVSTTYEPYKKTFKLKYLPTDDEVKQDSKNLVTCGAVYDALQNLDIDFTEVKEYVDEKVAESGDDIDTTLIMEEVDGKISNAVSNIPKFTFIGGDEETLQEYNLITLATEVSTDDELQSYEGLACLEQHRHEGTKISSNSQYCILKVPVQEGDVIRDMLATRWKDPSNTSGWKYAYFFNASDTKILDVIIYYDGNADSNYLDIRENGITAPANSTYVYINIWTGYVYGDSYTSTGGNVTANIITKNADPSLTYYDGQNKLDAYVPVAERNNGDDETEEIIESHYKAEDDIRIPRYENALGDIETILASVVGGGE